MNVLDDAQLIREYKAGNEHCFEKLLSRYKAPLFNYVIKMVKDRTIADDIFQNVWIAMIKFLPRYKEQNKFAPFIFKLAHSKIIDYFRKSKYEIIIDDFEPAEETNIDTNLEKEELISILNNKISRLPVEQREVLLLRQQTELTFKEIAQILDCPLNTVLSRMHNAVLHLRKVIKNV